MPPFCSFVIMPTVGSTSEIVLCLSKLLPAALSENACRPLKTN